MKQMPRPSSGVTARFGSVGLCTWLDTFAPTCYASIHYTGFSCTLSIRSATTSSVLPRCAFPRAYW